MKRYYKLLLIISILPLVCTVAQAQDTARTAYFPYQTGDFWVNEVYHMNRYEKDERIDVIADSVTTNKEIIYTISSTLSNPNERIYHIKIDSLGNVYSDLWYDRGDWVKILDPSLSKGEAWVLEKDSVDSTFVQYELAEVMDEYMIQFFGDSTLVREVRYAATTNDSTSTHEGYGRLYVWWSEKFGILESTGLELPIYQPRLKGLVLGETVFGDTTVYTPPDPSTIQKDYFPYQVGDIIVYNVRDSMGQTLPNSRIKFVSDSVDEKGNRWYSLVTEGYHPPIQDIMVDTSKNIYTTGWLEEKKDIGKVFNAYFSMGDPWVVLEQETFYELGSVWVLHNPRLSPGPDYWNFAEGPIAEIHYYEAEDSTKKPSEVSEKDKAEWDPQLGLTLKNDVNTKITYEIKGAFVNGKLYGDTAFVLVSIESESFGKPPQSFQLSNYPNPFNSTTNFVIDIKKSGSFTMEVYDSVGRKVADIFNHKQLSSGRHTIAWKARQLTTGMYFVRLRGNDRVQIQTITLLK